MKYFYHSTPNLTKVMKKAILSTILSLSLTYMFAQSSVQVDVTLNWSKDAVIHSPTVTSSTNIWYFEGATYNGNHPSLPYYNYRFPVNSNGRISYEIANAQYIPFDKKPSEDDDQLDTDLKVTTNVSQARKNYYGHVSFIPIRKVGLDRFEQLVSFTLIARFVPSINPPAVSSTRDVTVSALADGDIYKFAVAEPGMHKLDYTFLKDELGIDIDNVNPANIQLLGNGGGILPQLVSAERIDDLEENAIQIVGADDNVFNTNDYILFYAEGPHKWTYDEDDVAFYRTTNIYDNNNYYFIKISSDQGERIGTQASISATDYTTNTFNDYDRFEEDILNLLDKNESTHGSGKDWFGEGFNRIEGREKDYSSQFSFPNMTNDDIRVRTNFIARGNTVSSYQLTVNEQTNIKSISSVNVTSVTGQYANSGSINALFPSNNGNLNIAINYTGTDAHQAWIDYIEVNARRNLSMVNDQLSFRDANTLNANSSTYQLANANSNTEVWDITDPLNPVKQEISLSGNQLSFGTETSTLKEFIAFNSNGNFLSPTAIGPIDNQNIHSIMNIDMAIIYPKEFEAAAERLAEHRREFSGLAVETVEINQLFNEFSSGSQDVTAIRDFAKKMYTRTDRFKYLLLLGDGSYDYRNINEDGQNFIPPYETDNSLHDIESFPSDDYYGLLSDTEGIQLRGELDLSIGRIPVRTPDEAMNVVNKIIVYDTDTQTLGDWRNRITFAADDEDRNRHIKDTDAIAKDLTNQHEIYNLNKIYFDAFQQVSTPGGQRFPEATEAINRSMFQGHLIINYLGHGGPKGWAQERVLTLPDIDSWNNPTKLPLLVTATCSFTGFDDPTITSGGEEAILKADGGAVALLSTVRAVYASSNKTLTDSVFSVMFLEENNRAMPIGDVMRAGKNKIGSIGTERNSRKFLLIGDPAMRLAVPRYNVATTKINNRDITTIENDTIRALQKVTIEGSILDDNNQVMTNFNGKVYPSIFDKKIVVSTLVQDSGSDPLDFDLQKNIIFKGVASVTNGQFKFSFVVPKDINYEYGAGKISYYAENGSIDAAGYYNKLIIGGTDDNAVLDDQGPVVDVFMNNEDFVFGGITDENPTLFVKLSDDNGINVVGNSIGHDLTGVLDENTQNTYLLNDFYESTLDDFTKGEVRFPLFNLEEGLHRIKVKAWDTANNASEGYTEFVVATSGEVALDHVLNYPNPFTESTSFLFEHNMPDQPLTVQINIFSVSGRLVKTIQEDVLTSGYRINVDQIKWDGKDDFGGQLARGVYLYKVKVKPTTGELNINASESNFEKLVILK